MTTRKTLKAAQTTLRLQIVYRTDALRQLNSGKGATNLDVVNDFHEINGLITALLIIDGDWAGLFLAAGRAKNYAMTNVTNINALRVVS